jgi:hypothetical protein
MEKHLKQQIDYYMASVPKTDSLPKDNTLDLENFNQNDDLSSMGELTPVEDFSSNND